MVRIFDQQPTKNHFFSTIGAGIASPVQLSNSLFPTTTTTVYKKILNISGIVQSRNQPVETVKEIAIYWDYENIPLPSLCTPVKAAKCIHNAVSKYGRIVDRRIYFDFGKINPPVGAELDLSGFDLVNTPTRNTKETLDKKIIADFLTFAWDCNVRRIYPVVVLLTSDGDYSYILAKLRDRGVMNVVMYGKEQNVSQILVDNADVALNFEKDVLLFTPQKAKTSSSSSVELSISENDPKMCAEKEIICNEKQSSSNFYTDSSDLTKLCVCLYNNQTSKLKDVGSSNTLKSKKCWIPISQCHNQFRAASVNEDSMLSESMIKERNKKLICKIMSEGYVDVARLKLGKVREYVVVAWSEKSGLRNDLSVEVYLCLTGKGGLIAKKFFKSKQQAGNELLC